MWVDKTMASLKDLKERLAKFGQQHLLSFYEELDDSSKQMFLQDLNNIDYEEMRQLFEKAVNSMSGDVEKLDGRMKPVPSSQFESEENSTEDQLRQYYDRGLEEISRGHVGVLLMAGGQGTRLGVTYPKGMYSVGLPSNKTLFQIQAERIRRIQEIASKKTGRHGQIIWYIMTSGPTVGPTKNYLAEKNYFGLNPNDIVIFQQGLLPCFDFDGHILLEDKNRIALAPDGNGGIYKALDKCGILKDMQERGVLYVHAHSVDNILIKVADPVFIGYCTAKRADCGAKVVRKATPKEAVGVVCLVDGKFQVVEYSEITDSTANLRDSTGNLVFNAGNICNHFFSTKFLNTVADRYESQLKLHVAKKKIPHVNEMGKIIKPTTPNGIKIEKFVFDVFPFTNSFVTWEVPRESEFSALKNSDDADKDCPLTARRDLFNLHKRYVQNASGTVLGDEVEISPLLSYAGEGLESLVKDKTLEAPVHLSSDEEKFITNGHPGDV